VWPKAFSASVLISRRNVERPTETFYRWFYDLANKKERYDGLFALLGQTYFRKLIVDHAKGVEYSILTKGGSVSCSTRVTPAVQINPSFDNFTYSGFTLIDYELTNRWLAANRTRGDIFTYYESADDREPVEFDRVHEETGEEETWHFFEFDAEAQDPDLWVIPEAILVACNGEQ